MAEFVIPASIPIPFGPTAAGVLVAGGAYFLIGWAVEETTAAAKARFVIRDGNNVNAPYRVGVKLAADESNRDNVAMHGIVLQSGLFVDVTTGSVQGTMFVLPADLIDQVDGLLIVGGHVWAPEPDPAV